MKSINILDPDGRNTIMYSIEESRRQDVLSGEKYLSKLDFKSSVSENGVNKAFILPEDAAKDILVLSFMPEKVFINFAVVRNGTFKMGTVSTKIEYLKPTKTAISEFTYTPTRQRKIYIIDTETAEEIKSQLLMSDDGTIKGRVLLEQNKKYLAIELRKDGYKKIGAAFVRFLEDDNKYVLNIDKKEARLILLDRYKEIIDEGKCVEVPLKETKIVEKNQRQAYNREI